MVVVALIASLLASPAVADVGPQPATPQPGTNGGGTTPSGAGDQVLFISTSDVATYGPNSVENGTFIDASYVSRLRDLGYDVKVRQANILDSGSLRDMDLVVVSPHVLTTDLQQWLKMASVPVLVMKPAVVRNLGLLGPAASSYETASELVLVDQSHPISAALADAPEFSGATFEIDTQRNVTFMGGSSIEPGNDQQVIASTSNGIPALFAYDIGAVMDNGIAQGCRVAFPVDKQAMANLSWEAWLLFDGAVSWLRSADCTPDSNEPGMPGRKISTGSFIAGNSPTCNVPASPSPDGPDSKRWIDDIEIQNLAPNDDIYYVAGQFGVIACRIVNGSSSQLWSNTFDGRPVHDLELDLDGGWLYVGGKANTKGIPGFRSRRNVERIALANNPNGDFDDDFDLAFNTGAVRSIAVANNGNTLYIGGTFTQVKASNGDFDRRSLTKVTLNGANVNVVQSFDAEIKSLEAGDPDSKFTNVIDIALTPGEGALYIGGQFTHVGGDQPANERDSIARVKANSDVQPFAPQLEDPNDGFAQIEEIHYVNDSNGARIIACGDWWSTEGQGQLVDDGANNRRSQYNVGKFFTWSGNSVKIAGRVWGPYTDGGVMTCTPDPVNKLLYIGGHYDYVNDATDYPGGLFNQKLSAVNLDTGLLIARWDTNTDSVRGVDAAAINSQGTYTAGGAFTQSGTNDLFTPGLVQYDLIGPDSRRAESTNAFVDPPPAAVGGLVGSVSGGKQDDGGGLIEFLDWTVMLNWYEVPAATHYQIWRTRLIDSDGNPINTPMPELVGTVTANPLAPTAIYSFEDDLDFLGDEDEYRAIIAVRPFNGYAGGPTASVLTSTDSADPGAPNQGLVAAPIKVRNGRLIAALLVLQLLLSTGGYDQGPPYFGGPYDDREVCPPESKNPGMPLPDFTAERMGKIQAVHLYGTAPVILDDLGAPTAGKYPNYSIFDDAIDENKLLDMLRIAYCWSDGKVNEETDNMEYDWRPDSGTFNGDPFGTTYYDAGGVLASKASNGVRFVVKPGGYAGQAWTAHPIP